MGQKTKFPINNLMNRWVNELSRQFSKGKVQMVNKYMNKCSISLAVKGTANQNFIQISPHSR
jgi:hypothetical protein